MWKVASSLRRDSTEDKWIQTLDLNQHDFLPSLCAGIEHFALMSFTCNPWRRHVNEVTDMIERHARSYLRSTLAHDLWYVCSQDNTNGWTDTHLPKQQSELAIINEYTWRTDSTPLIAYIVGIWSAAMSWWAAAMTGTTSAYTSIRMASDSGANGSSNGGKTAFLASHAAWILSIPVDMISARILSSVIAKFGELEVKSCCESTKFCTRRRGWLYSSDTMLSCQHKDYPFHGAKP